ncbi:MAG: DUF5655 domain-containing protein [bacterium]|nr:DUF5655 domain-containing protein [bacterium]
MGEEILIKDGVRYRFWGYDKGEDKLERIVINHYKEIFGENSLCFGKREIKTKAGIGTIPDGFVIDIDSKKWYIVEVELAEHGYNHIHSQLSKFQRAYKKPETRSKLADAFYKDIENDVKKKSLFTSKGIGEVYKCLSDIVQSEPIIALIVDEDTEEVTEAGEDYKAEIIKFKTFVRQGTEKAEKPVYIHSFKPLYISLEIEKPRKKKIKKEAEIYSEAGHLMTALPEIKALYEKLKSSLLEIDPDVKIRPVKHYVGFISKTNFIDIHIQKKALKIWLNMKKGELNDPKGLFRDVSRIGHWGNGDYELRIQDDKDIEYITSLAQQSYRKNSK